MSDGGFREVDAAEAVRLADEGFHVIDVREPGEWDAGHVAGLAALALCAQLAACGEPAQEPPATQSASLLQLAQPYLMKVAIDDHIAQGRSTSSPPHCRLKRWVPESRVQRPKLKTRAPSPARRSMNRQ